MQHNIYFRKDNWHKFKDEKKKSELINSLLAEHYKDSPKKHDWQPDEEYTEDEDFEPYVASRYRFKPNKNKWWGSEDEVWLDKKP